MTRQLTISKRPENVKQTLFPIQCVDTMKVSRDRAKEPVTKEKRQLISKQIAEIASLGANCIALGTPYNEEFLPYLRIWVDEAREQGLRVWFRGNFAEWEGWFGYKKSLSPDDHIKKTTDFIENNADLFHDGDIFTATPEVENGSPFHPMDSSQKTTLLRSFLVKEQDAIKKSLKKIDKNVTTNFVSMSGGVATSVLDAPTISALGNTVTLDHYVKNPEGIDEYITHFADRYQARIVFGEFGAPIPDINGRMDEATQATFVGELLDRIYHNQKQVVGLNYWTLSESSTALLNKNNEEKKVTQVLRTYYQPSLIHGIVKNESGKGIEGIEVVTKDGVQRVTTNKEGEFRLIIPAKPTTITLLENEQYQGYEFSLSPSIATEYTTSIALRSQNMPLFYRLKSIFYRKI